MFGILRYDSQNAVVNFTPRGDTSNVNPSHHSACDYCRRKKLRCSGETSGCTRCKDLFRDCSYTMACQAKGRGRRATSKGSVPRNKQPSPSSAKEIHAEDSLNGNRITLEYSKKPGDLQEPRFSHLEPELFDLQQGEIPPRQLDFELLEDFIDAEATFPRGTEDIIDTETAFLHDIENLVDVEAVFPSVTDNIINAESTFPQVQFPLSPYAPLSDGMGIAYSSIASNHGCPPLSTCACTSTILFLNEDLDETVSSITSYLLPSSLAAGKEVLSSLSSLFLCVICMNRTEMLMLLVFTYERLVLLFSDIINEITQDVEVETSNATMAATKSGIGTMSLMLGEYEVSSAKEWHAILRTLAKLQLKTLQESLADLGSKGKEVLPYSQCAKITSLSQKVGSLSKKIDLSQGTHVLSNSDTKEGW